MRILELRALHGPNVFACFPVVRLTLDLEDLADTHTAMLDGLAERLTGALPGLAAHTCSRGHEGGLLERMREGTYLAHVTEHVAIELARVAGMDVGYGKTVRIEKPGRYAIAVELANEDGIRLCLEEAVRVVERALRGEPIDVAAFAEEVRAVVERTSLGPSTEAVVRAAEARGIPWARLDRDSLVVLGHGKHRKLLQATTTSGTGLVAAEIASDKELTKDLLRRAGIPAPRGIVVRTEQEALAALAELGPPVVVKPLDGNQGKGVTMDVETEDDVRRAFAIAQGHRARVLVEERVHGRNYRVLVVDGRMIAASERVPPQVIGDGEHTVRELVAIANSDPRRADGHQGVLTKIPLDDICERFVARRGRTLDDVPAPGETFVLRDGVNLSTGGTARDVTDLVHPATRSTCERAARALGLDVCGVDLVMEDVSRSLAEQGAIIELNAAPGIRMHVHPSEGEPRDAGGAIVESMYPGGSRGRIPIVAVTGTNGKTTTTRMIAHAIAHTGLVVGTTTTEGVWIDGRCVLDGDTTGADSARLVLFDPTVEAAVLETARGGIVRRGLGWDWADVGVITNIQADHLGLDGIWDIEDLLHVKSLVAERVREGGTVVLNAEDPRLVALPESDRMTRIPRRYAFFALDPRCPALRAHLRAGGLGYSVLGGWLCELEGDGGSTVTRVVRAADLPCTFAGTAAFQVQNALAAIAALRGYGMEHGEIGRALRSFEDNPGRLTLLAHRGAHVLVDYGHNADAIGALAATVARWPVPRRTAVVSLPGDRDDRAIAAAATVVARSFDRVIAKDDRDRRGRAEGEVPALVARACAAHGRPCERILDEDDAIQRALATAVPGELVLLVSEDPGRAVARLRSEGARPVSEVPSAPPAARAAAR